MQCTANYPYAHIIIKYHVNIFYCVKTINDYYLFIIYFHNAEKNRLKPVFSLSSSSLLKFSVLEPLGKYSRVNSLIFNTMNHLLRQKLASSYKLQAQLKRRHIWATLSPCILGKIIFFFFLLYKSVRRFRTLTFRPTIK